MSKKKIQTITLSENYPYDIDRHWYSCDKEGYSEDIINENAKFEMLREKINHIIEILNEK